MHHILYDRHREPVFNSVMTHFPAVYIRVYLSYLKTKDFNLYQKKKKSQNVEVHGFKLKFKEATLEGTLVMKVLQFKVLHMSSGGRYVPVWV